MVVVRVGQVAELDSRPGLWYLVDVTRQRGLLVFVPFPGGGTLIVSDIGCVREVVHLEDSAESMAFRTEHGLW